MGLHQNDIPHGYNGRHGGRRISLTTIFTCDTGPKDIFQVHSTALRTWSVTFNLRSDCKTKISRLIRNIEYDGDGADGNYGPAYGRLKKIKGQYDPGNLFRLNSNIEPAA